jgi:hypothetical protein
MLQGLELRLQYGHWKRVLSASRAHDEFTLLQFVVHFMLTCQAGDGQPRHLVGNKHAESTTPKRTSCYAPGTRARACQAANTAA